MRSPFVAQMRRAMRAAGARKPQRATTALQRAMAAAMMRTATGSLSTLTTLASPKPAAKTKTRRTSPKTPRKTAAPSSGDRRLSTVIAQLRAVRAAMPDALLRDRTAPPSRPPPTPRGARFLDRTHACAAGTRDFRLYLPAGRPQGPLGLIVMLHGCTQDPNDFATGTGMNAVAQRHGLAVAYPAQTRAHNRAACWNWFTPAHQARGAGEPALLASLTRALMREFGLERGAVFVAGLSAGGAMAAILADTYADVFSAAGVHSGLARGAAHSLVSAQSAMRKGATATMVPPRRRSAGGRNGRRIVFHGDADAMVNPANVDALVRAAVGTRPPAHVTRAEAAGRAYLRSDYTLPDGTVDLEVWRIAGTGHAWSGGTPSGSFTDAKGPDASAEMVRFFLAQQA